MRGFELEPGSFFMCTETSPRCFIIQQVIDLDQALNEVKPSSESEAPVLPFLPWWFTSECRQQLLSIPAESPSQASPGQSTEPSGTPEPNQMTPEQLKARLKTQLEYYFSRENLINDRFLRCQMDADQYVPIRILASFPKIAALTHDSDLIVEVLRESSQVQVDEAGEKVRPVTKRCTIILREIPENADEKEVKSMFDECPPYQSLTYGLNNSWYVTFETEEATQKAFLHLQNLGKTFNGKPVYARIKNGGAPIVADGMPYPGKASPDPLKGYITIHDASHNVSSANSASSAAHNAATSNGAVVYGSHLCTHGPSNTCNGHGNCSTTCANTFNLGQILASYGYVPRATYRPAVSAPAGTAAATAALPTTGRSAATTRAPDATTSSITFAQPTFLPRAQISVVGVQKPLPQTTDSLTVPGMDSYELSADQSPSHDGLLPDPPLHAIPNLGRQRITDVPRMTKQRRSPLFYDNSGGSNRQPAADAYYANGSAATGNYYATPTYTTTPLNKIHVTVQPNTSNNSVNNDGEWTSVQHRGGAHSRGNRDGGGAGGRQRGGSFNDNNSGNNRNYRDMGRERASSYRQSNTSNSSSNYGNRLSVRDNNQRARHSPDVSSYSGSSGGGGASGGRGDRRGGGNGGPRKPLSQQNEVPPKPVVTILGAKPSQCAGPVPTVTKLIAPSASSASSLAAESATSKSSVSGDAEAQQLQPRCKQNSESSEYNFTEVEFPCLIEKEKKQQKEKEKLPFSAVVAGKRNAPKPEEKKTSYVQALKKQRPSQPQQAQPQQPK